MQTNEPAEALKVWLRPAEPNRWAYFGDSYESLLEKFHTCFGAESDLINVAEVSIDLAKCTGAIVYSALVRSKEYRAHVASRVDTFFTRDGGEALVFIFNPYDNCFVAIDREYLPKRA